MLAALRQRNFALLWVGQLVSLVGDWVLLVALPFFIYDLTGSTLATGGMFIAMTVPRLLLGSVAGVFVDRWDRRRTMIAADVSRAAILLPLLLVRSPERAWIVFLVAFVESAIAQFFLPAKSAIIPRLVGEEDLLPANSLNSLSDSLTRLVGPALGGALFGLLGLTSVVYLDSLSFLVSGLAISLIAVPPAPAPPSPAVAGEGPAARPVASPWAAVWREWLDGLRLVRRDRVIAATFAIMATVMIGEGIMVVLLVAWTKGVLGVGAAEFGWLMSAEAVGGLAGGILVGQVGKAFAPARLMGLSSLAVGALIIAIVNIPSLPIDLVLIALVGLTVVGLFVTGQTLLQSRAADEFRGRVFGALMTSWALAQLLGMALASVLGGRVGVVPMFDAAGALYCAAGLLALALLGLAARERTSQAAAQPGQGEAYNAG
jgi:MFS family permease